MVETSGKDAVKILNVIQIPLTFLVACLLAFLKRATMKNRSRPFHTGREQRDADSVCNACRADCNMDTDCSVIQDGKRVITETGERNHKT